MRVPTILILSRSEAAMLLGSAAAPRPAAVLSIRGPHEPRLEVPPDVTHRLELVFDDVDVPVPGDELGALEARARQRWAAQTGRPLVPPSAVDVDRVIVFADELRDVAGPVLFQCQAGMSRSPAAALVCLASWTGPGHEADCVRAVRASRPAAVPHAGLVRMGDAALGRDGALVRALAAVPS
ncbi:MAG TPA: hypothetical protein VF796_06495 [Humisphaera sp.]